MHCDRLALVLLMGLILPRFLGAEEPQVNYLTQVKPLLKKACYACHGGLKQEGSLRLDTVNLMRTGGDSGETILPGNPEQSLLLERITEPDPELRMPPEHEGEPFTDKQVKLLSLWIREGAQGPADEEPEADPKAHWAFQPIIRPEVPEGIRTGWGRNALDTFLAQKHQELKLTPEPEASRLVLLRRLYLDLIGLPPTQAEIDAFVQDTRPDWYERKVEELLKSPAHGERWARHWMDIWRYSDWWGFGQQLRFSQKHIWHWRDWIISSLNDDLSYAEMIQLMLAVDELHPNDLEKLPASGYLARNFMLFNRDQWMDELIEHVGKGFLGLTLNCAKCHDHKYDPISQTDYYRFRAFFEPYHVRMDVLPGETNLIKNGLPRAYDGWLEKPTYFYVRGQESKPDKSIDIKPGIPELFQYDELQVEEVNLPREAWQPGHREWVQEAYLKSAEQKLAQARKNREKAQLELKNGTEGSSKLDRKRLAVTELHFDLAQIEKESLDLHLTLMQKQQEHDGLTGEPLSEESIQEAIRAERKVELARSQYKLAMEELALLEAKDDKQKSAIRKKIAQAEKSVKQATEMLSKEIEPTDSFTPLVGAKWTPTRFLESRTDDPDVPFPSTSSGRRTALAKWLIDRHNPLTARVAVNHLWARHMGQPLVPTMFEFGRSGTAPENPELLDWLAVELIENNWSMKHIHRLIVNSAVYRMKSSFDVENPNQQIDPENRYWWRRTPLRLESQVIRDCVLTHTGTLDPTIGGPPVPAKEQANSKRRSLYFFHSQNDRNLFLTTFDEAMVKECYRREQSIVPQQALALTNSEFILKNSKLIAEQLSEENETEEQFIRKSFLVLLGIQVSEQELKHSRHALEQWRVLSEESEKSARDYFIWTLLNHHDFVTLR